ncbi:MAG: transporter substrate-binding domain-containing protein [Tissierellia bacterium]|nr:transporter substrate-binding domain-containing protein [Tissierellia bacterium]
MLKKLISILLIISMVLSVVACGKNNAGNNQAGNKENGNNQASENTEDMGPILTKVKKEGKIVLGTSADYPPYEWLGKVDGEMKVIGFDIALAESIAEELGVELEIQDMDFKGLLPALSLGDVDFCIAGMVVNEERKQQVDFSEEYYSGGQGMLIRKEDAEKYKTQDDFSGAKVGAQQATLQEELANTLKGANPDLQPNVNNMVLELKGKALDAIVIAAPPGKQFEKINDDLIFVDVGFPNEDGMAVAVAKGNEDLLEIINKVIKDWKDSGKVEEEIAHYMELSEEGIEQN